MADLATLDPQLDEDHLTCRAIVECPKGARAKYAFDPQTGAFALKRLLPDGMSFPLDFGFVPGTQAADEDPFDIMLLNDEPTAMGALVEARLIAIIEGEQAEKGETFRNDRLLAVACVSHLFKDVAGPDDLDEAVLHNLTQFWVNYDALRGVTFKVLAVKGPKAAMAALKQTRAAG